MYVGLSYESQEVNYRQCCAESVRFIPCNSEIRNKPARRTCVFPDRFCSYVSVAVGFEVSLDTIH